MKHERKIRDRIGIKVDSRLEEIFVRPRRGVNALVANSG